MKKQILYKAYSKTHKKWFWFDVMWGNASQFGSGYIGMLPMNVNKRTYIGQAFSTDNRVCIDPMNCSRIIKINTINKALKIKQFT